MLSMKINLKRTCTLRELAHKHYCMRHILDAYKFLVVVWDFGNHISLNVPNQKKSCAVTLGNKNKNNAALPRINAWNFDIIIPYILE